jgi:aryl-alcohol dehydrogenase-like predicted oxidoreductase
MPRRVPFGRTGLSVSSLGFGAAPVGFLKTEQDQVARILNFLLDHGVNVIDTATMYEGSEEAIGQAVGHRRKEYVLITKCGTRTDEFPDPVWSPALITKTVDRALRRLRTDIIDVMLLHSCDLATLTEGSALTALAKAKSAGKIRHAGYSGDNEAAAYAAGLPEIDAIETSVSIADQVNIDSVLPVAKKHNVGVIAKRPIANAAWKSSSQQPGLYGSYAQEYHHRLIKMGIVPEMLGVIGAPATAWPELALRFTLSQPGVHTAIIGTTNPVNAQANLKAAAKGALPAEAVEKIREAFRRARGGDPWPGQT